MSSANVHPVTNFLRRVLVTCIKEDVKKLEMITTREFAEAVGRPKITVLRWLQKGLIPGAITIQETSGPTYRIPVSAIAMFKDKPPRPRGRPPKAKKRNAD